MKPALARLRESRAARARELSEEVLAVQERLDAGLEALTERTEDNAALGTQVSPLGKHAFSYMSALITLGRAMLCITYSRELMQSVASATHGQLLGACMFCLEAVNRNDHDTRARL